jgi:hypothetical protein
MVRQEKTGADIGPILVFMSCHSPSSFTMVECFRKPQTEYYAELRLIDTERRRRRKVRLRRRVKGGGKLCR